MALYNQLYRGDTLAIDFSDPLVILLLIVCVYIYECYLVYLVLNTVMLFQIWDMEKKEIREKRDLMKKLDELKRQSNIEF